METIAIIDELLFKFATEIKSNCIQDDEAVSMKQYTNISKPDSYLTWEYAFAKPSPPQTKKELIVHGLMRAHLKEENSDYTDIATIILKYDEQAYAKYFEDEDEISDMRFGDICLGSDDEYMVLNINNQLDYIGTKGESDVQDIDIYIPLSITQCLDNAVEFYSAFDNIPDFEQIQIYDDYYETTRYHLTIALPANDAWIVKKLGGPLNPKFTDIKATWYQFRFQALHIDGWPFNPLSNKINHKEIDRFFELRDSGTDLIVIRVKYSWSSGFKVCRDVVSVLWNYARNDKVRTSCYDYVGPKTEKSKMFKYLEAFYDHNKDVSISVVEYEGELKDRNLAKILSDVDSE